MGGRGPVGAWGVQLTDIRGKRILIGVVAFLAALTSLSALPSSTFATALPSVIKENTTLTPAGSPYTGTSTIETGVTLKVEPGVKLTVGQLTVQGTLKAEGTTGEPIVFTSAAKVPQARDWGNVVFEPGSGASVLDHAEIAYGGAVTNSGAIEVKNSSPTITNSTIRSSGYYGIKVFAGSPNIGNNKILNNTGIGAYFAAEAEKTLEINFHDNLVEGNGSSAAVFVEPGAGPTVATSLGHNTITKNSSLQAIYYNGGPKEREIPPDIANNTVSGNTGSSGNQVAFSGVLAKSATWEAPTAPLYIGSGLKVNSGLTLTLKPGVTIHGGSLEVFGTLKAEGESSAPVVYEPASESSRCGSLKFEPGSGASVLDHVELYRCGANVNSGAIEVKNSSPTITNSTIRSSGYYGIKVFAGSPNIGNNKILNNTGIGAYFAAEAEKTLEINFHDNLVEGNGSSAAVFVEPGAGPTVATSLGHNTITKNSSLQAIYYNGGPKEREIPPDIANNTVSGNTGSSGNQVAFSGVLAKSATWEAPTAPLYIGSGLKVNSGLTLTLKPGVTIHGGSLEVFGTLKAEGESSAPVVYEPASESSRCGSLKFEPGSGASVLDHVELYRCGANVNSGAIEVKNSSPTITNSTIRSSGYYGIKVFAGSPNIGNNKILNNTGIGAYFAAEAEKTLEINFHDNLVEGNGSSAAVFVEPGAGPTVATSLGHNTITKNSSLQAIYYNGGPKEREIPPDIANNTVSGNTGSSGNQVAFSGVLAKSATWEAPAMQLYVPSGVKVASGAVLTLKPGVTIYAPNLEVLGTLRAEGTSPKPVFLTGLKSEKTGEWGSIKFEPGSGESVLDHAEVAYGGSALPSNGMIEVKGSHPTITNSTIRGAKYYGIKVTESGSPRIEWNRFRGNASGLSYSGTGKLSAPNNDWNCTSGPKPAGCGDSVTSNVNWQPDVPLPELAGHCRGKESQCKDGADPVSLATGALNYSHRDLLLTNKGKTPLEFARAYYSGSSADAGLGQGWSQTGLASATEQESGEVLVVRQDGRQDLFQKAGGSYVAPSGVTDTLAKVGSVFQLTTLEGTIYRFDESGRIASITDDHGLKTTYAYNAEGRLSTITDPSAQTLTFAYNGSNHIGSVKDSTGREVKFAYSTAGDLETVTDALGGVTKYAYDTQHRMTSITDTRGSVILKNTYNGEGKITEQEDGLKNLWKLKYEPSETIVTEPQGGKIAYGFDVLNRVTSETDQLGRKTTTSYDAAGNVDEVVQPGGAKWEFDHDAAGNLTSTVDPEGGERSYEYDAQNHLTKYTGARGDSWGYEWSKANDLTKVTDPEGGETTFTYNESGQPLSSTDPDKHKTEFTYDTRGNRLSLTDTLSHKTSFEYNSRNYLIAKTAPGLKAEGFERNALGDLLTRTTPEGNKTKYAYDANGLPTQITDPGEGVWKIAYNAMERPTTYTDPLEQQTKISYNGNLKPTKVINRRGKETTYGYDLANQITEVHAPEGGDWTIGYDGRGNRTSMVDPREGETTYEYDLLDRMTNASEPLEVSTEYGYDANGDLTSVKDPRGNTTEYGYDKLGRLVEVAQPLEKTTSFEYDLAGNLLAKSNAAGTLEYGYDAANRLTAVKAGEATLRSYGYDSANRLTSAVDGESHNLEIGYDGDGRPTSIKDGRGQSLTRAYNSRGLLTKQVDGRGTLEYGYDKLGQLTSLTDPQGKATSFAYDPEEDLKEVKRPNGVVTNNVYDDAGRLSEATSKDELGATLESLKYGYDPAGNVTSRYDARLKEETTFAYDPLERLTESNPPGEGADAYAYDPAGNRTEADGTTYEYNALNQLTESSDGTTYGYDGAGRLTSRTNGAKETTYTWDLFDHLASVESEAGSTSYAYDALGRLSQKASGPETQVTHYGDLSDLATSDANGKGETVASYVQGAKGLLEERTGSTAYPLANVHGDIVSVTNSGGAVESRQSFDPWGVRLSGPERAMGYLGSQERRGDPASGLIQMGERSYAPGLGAFLSEDPVLVHPGSGMSADRHLYVRDNPLNRYDLNGRDVCVPTPFGDACAEDAAEGIVRIDEEIEDGINSVPKDLWNLTKPSRHWLGNRAEDFAKSDAGEWFGDRGDEVGRTFTCIAERVVQRPGPVGCQEKAEEWKPEPEAPEPPNSPPPGVPGKDPLPAPAPPPLIGRF